MKKILFIIALFIGTTLLADVYCMSAGEGVLWCYDDNGHDWYVYVAE